MYLVLLSVTVDEIGCMVMLVEEECYNYRGEYIRYCSKKTGCVAEEN